MAVAGAATGWGCGAGGAAGLGAVVGATGDAAGIAFGNASTGIEGETALSLGGGIASSLVFVAGTSRDAPGRGGTGEAADGALPVL